HEMARDIDALAEYFAKNNLRYGGFSPNLLQLIKNDPRFNFKAAFMGGDSVSHLFNENYDMITIYASSEAGPICIFWIDKPYDITPAGYNVSGLDIVLLDEKGRPSDEGIICFSLPYFRGYTNDNKASSFTGINGRKYFVGSDWVRRGKDGLYTVLGRTDDMVKITGNRVSLKGLAAAIKRILNLDFCYVSVIIRNGVKLLAAYYMADKELDTSAANSTLREHLPNYMTIAWFIRIDHVPINANGKVDAHAFPKPDLSLRPSPYIKPVNSVQKTMCEAIRHVLGLEGSVGIDDDFFMLGGDSIGAIQVVLRCGIAGLSVQMIYEGRTARKISALLEQAANSQHEGSGDVPLNVIQLYMMDEIKKHAGVPTLNVPFRINIKPDVDLWELSRAISEAVKAHPILSSVVAERNGRYVFEHRAEFEREIPVEEMTDEELDAQIADFVRPFTFDGEPLFRGRVIKTPTHRAVLLDICHVVCDGWSAVQFISDIVAALNGERLERDNTFGILREEAEYRESDLFAADMEYFAGVCRGGNWSTLPKQDHITGENTSAETYEEFSFARDDAERISGKYGLGRNGFYIAAAAMAMSACNNSEDVMFTWTWHGRADDRRLKAVGVFIKYLPVALHLTDGVTLSALFEEISTQIKEGISHGRVSYCDEEVYGDDLLLCLLYQGDIYEHLEDSSVIESLEAIPLNNLTCDNALNVEILDAKTEYGVSLGYNGKLYDEASMKRFAGLFCRACELMLTMEEHTAISAVRKQLLQ
ncbi:MAG: AMP-binding protein, partial [Synergistaceae bacterium]|nr:AMP-binding protein [Synergistaceae bacterium]